VEIIPKVEVEEEIIDETDEEEVIDEETVDSGQLNTKFGLSFAPVGNNAQFNFTLNHMQTLNINLLRFAEDWGFREPTKGNFKWSASDRRIDFITNNDLSLLLTIQSDGPDWACDSAKQNEKSCVFNNPEEFRNYISNFLQRYSNKIDKIQFGNEMLNPDFYIGTVEEFAVSANILYEETKKWSPETKVVLGGFDSGDLRFVTACETNTTDSFFYGGSYRRLIENEEFDDFCSQAWVQTKLDGLNFLLENVNYDIVDVHTYHDVENWPAFYEAMNAKVSTPILVSEFGGPFVFNCGVGLTNCELAPTETQATYTDEYHAERVQQYLDAINNADILEAYYFKLNEIDELNRGSAKSGLVNLDLDEKPAYFVFKEFNE